MATDGKGSRTQALRDKVRQLEEQIARAEAAELAASREATDWTHAVLSGKVSIEPAPLLPLLACYPAPVLEHPYPTFMIDTGAPKSVTVGFMSGIPRHAIREELDAWDQSDVHLPRKLRVMLLSIFFPYMDQFNFSFHIGRFRHNFRLPPEDSNAFHPCLIYAVALAACSCAGPDLQKYEMIFVERCQEHCAAALATVDRLEHFMWASVVLGWYWCRRGKVINAHAVSSTVAHWAIACKLHEISDPESYCKEQPSDAVDLLGPIQDIVHFSERVNLWWAVFILDRRVALVSSLPPLFKEESQEIKTVWPRACAELSMDTKPSFWGTASINDLFIHGSPSADVSNDSLLALRAKAGVLLDHAMWVSHTAKAHSSSPFFWTIHISIDNALTRVVDTLPPLTDQREIVQGEEGKRLNPSLVLVRTYIHTAYIVLHSIEGDGIAPEEIEQVQEESSTGNGCNRVESARERRRKLAHEKCLMASHRMANDVRRLANVSFLYSHACLGPTWVTGAEVCAREVRHLQNLLAEHASAGSSSTFSSPSPSTPRSDTVSLDGSTTSAPDPTVDNLTKRLRIHKNDLEAFIRGLTWLVSYHPNLMPFIERLAVTMGVSDGGGSSSSPSLSASTPDDRDSVYGHGSAYASLSPTASIAMMTPASLASANSL